MTETKCLLEKKRQIIFAGAPGTGKTREAKRLACFMLTGEQPGDDFETALSNCQFPNPNEAGSWDIVQFHPSYNYDDFVRGVRIRTEGNNTVYRTEDGPLLAMATAATNNPGGKYILIIDEINRANVAAVLGEMIYALEYRGQPVSLQYDVPEDPGPHEGAANAARIRTALLPESLYIIGTMNTADRSIGHLDYAVRRRFAFVGLKPDRSVIERNPEEVRNAALAKFDQVANLFSSAGTLSADYRAEDVQPGHSYFIVADQTDLDLRMKYEIGPLLREYVADGVLKPAALAKISEIEANGRAGGA